MYLPITTERNRIIPRAGFAHRFESDAKYITQLFGEVNASLFCLRFTRKSNKITAYLR